MSVRDDGGPAFPAEGGSASGLHANPGMSLRDWFAGQALVGCLVASAYNGWGEPNEYQAAQAAKNAGMVADAMLEARKK